MSSLIQQFRAARRVATPLLCITTPDPRQTSELIQRAFTQGAPPIFQWDVASGLSHANKEAETLLSGLHNSPRLLTNPAQCLIEAAPKLPEKSILLMLNLHRFIDNPPVMQALWNLREPFKASKRMVVALCPDMKLPPELSQDMLVLNEALPTTEELREIVTRTFRDADLTEPDDDTMQRAVDALTGLAAFPAEQSTAMSLTPSGLDLDTLWERKRQLVEQTPGLSIWRGGETFVDVAGYANVKGFLGRVLEGRRPPRGIVFIDEIEKMFSGQNDTSGVSQGLLGTLLTWMQDRAANGCIFIGSPGTGKSAVAKAVGGEGGIPTVAFDVNATKGSLVGQSEQTFRQALKVVDAVTDGNALFVATCNKIGVLPPELRRRFTCGTFFFDLPTPEERACIWSLYLHKFQLSPQPLPPDEGWTGAEVRQCASLSHMLNCTLVEAAAYIVPVAISARAQMEELREQAHQRFISATYPGYFDKARLELPRPINARAINLEGDIE